jgi:hypothetical protein
VADPNEFDVIVVGGGVAGAVCAATLAQRGAHTALVAETKNLGHNTRSVEVDGHLVQIQPPVWAFAWNAGGSWARVIREQNLSTKIHLPGEAQIGVRGSSERQTIPMLLSASSVCDALFGWLGAEIDAETRAKVVSVVQQGMLIPPHELCQMHDYALSDWLNDLNADDLTRQVVLNLSAMLAGLPIESVEKHFSVYGAFVTIRLTQLTGEGTVVNMEPDIPQGLIYPLAERIREYGGEVLTGTPIAEVLVEDGTAIGVRTKSGREIRARHVALAVGNSRLPHFFGILPHELEAPMAKELPLQHEDVFVIRVFDKPIVDAKSYTLIADVERGLFNWIVPDSAMAPWNHHDDRDVVVMWGSRGRADLATIEEFEAYLDDVGEDTYPGWKDAICARASISHRHHWMNPLYIGPKVPRRSSIGNLWYAGDGTLPVSGLGCEQAAFAGYDSATLICGELGLPQQWQPRQSQSRS